MVRINKFSKLSKEVKLYILSSILARIAVRMFETVTLLRNYSLFLITSKYRFDKLCLYSITEIIFIDDPLSDDCSRGWE